MKTYVLGGGCFWCIDAVFRRLKGVKGVESGYAGGDSKQANYYRVASGTTGHAEVVRVTFDETIMPVETLLDIFFLIHNPTTLNRQGNDVGPQYRSIAFYENIEQEATLKAAIARAQAVWEMRLVTKLEPLEAFFIAEDEHQDYFNKNPAAGYCQAIIAPKIVKARHAYINWFQEEE
jgi:peptide-methionine (S)-S-oxide reductase